MLFAEIGWAECSITTTEKRQNHVQPSFRTVRDLSQLVVGAFVMALPVAVTGEVWDLGEQLSLGRILAILGISLLTLAMFVWGLFYGKHIGKYQGHFLKRVVSAYLVTFMVALLLLVLFDKAPLQDLQVTFARCVLVAFPACFAATAVDYMK